MERGVATGRRQFRLGRTKALLDLGHAQASLWGCDGANVGLAERYGVGVDDGGGRKKAGNKQRASENKLQVHLRTS